MSYGLIHTNLFNSTRSFLSTIFAVDFTIDQQPYLQGYLAVTAANAFLTNENELGAGIFPTLTGPLGIYTHETVDQTILELYLHGFR